MNASSWLSAAASSIDRLDAELILANAIQKERIFLHGHPEYELNEREKAKADQDLARRQKREPLAYILGYKEFYGRKFQVTPDTLIPRPETEAIIDFVKSLPFVTSFPQTETLRILDVGTGSGCIAITLGLELPNSQITAVDISAKALDCAQYNIQALGATNISTKISNLLESTPEKYDIIVANLPYVDPDWEWLDRETLSYEPDSALYADDGGLALIKKLILDAPAHLSEGGYLILEADLSQHQKIRTFATENTDFISSTSQSHQSLVLALRLPQSAAPSPDAR